MDLPMPLDEIKRQVEVLLARSRSNDVLYIRDADSPIPSIGWHLQHTSLDNDPTLKKLNQFADIIGGMNAAGHYLLCKALSTDYRQGLDELLRTAANINPGCMDRYEVIPETTTHQALGQWLVEHDRLEERVPETLRPYLDYRSIGVAYCIEHEGELLPTGYTGIRKDAAKQIQEKHGTIRLACRLRGLHRREGGRHIQRCRYRGRQRVRSEHYKPDRGQIPDPAGCPLAGWPL